MYSCQVESSCWLLVFLVTMIVATIDQIQLLLHDITNCLRISSMFLLDLSQQFSRNFI